jgi:peptidase M23-like protein
MQRNIDREPKSRFGALAVLAALFVVFIIAFFGFSFRRWEGKAPVVGFSRDFKTLGRKPALSLDVTDSGAGLKSISVTLQQKGQTINLVDEHYPGPQSYELWKIGDRTPKHFDLGKLLSEKYRVQDGPATLEVSTSDYSYRHFFRGNRAIIRRDFAFDLYPPRVDLVSEQHYINQGGTECVVFRVTPDAIVAGVQAGPNFFPSYTVPQQKDPNLRFSLFAFAYYMDTNSPLKVIARDEAGNEAVAGFWYKLFPKKFKESDIHVEDPFLQKVVPEIMSRSPEMKDEGDLVKNFVEINNDLRKINHHNLAEMSKKSERKFLWNGAFLQLSNSQVEASFADHRTYLYKGKVIDHQDHVGFDLSVVQHYPIEAANDGVVLYADFFGIYGNCVLIDHGYGLVSLYGHMSSIDVKPGQAVKKKQVIGKSGDTGLAGGDHLHFGLFLDGVPVNPTEWWDQHWIDDHVLNRMKAAAAAPQS